MLEGSKSRVERLRFLRRINANEALRQDLHTVNVRLLNQNLVMSEKIIKLQEEQQAAQENMQKLGLQCHSLKRRLRREETENLALSRKNIELRDRIKDIEKKLQEELIKNAKLDARANQALDLLEKEKQSKLRKCWRGTRRWFRDLLHA